MMTSKTEQIRTLNDRLRQNLSTGIGTAVITTGVAALGVEAVARIVKAIAIYDDFCNRGPFVRGRDIDLTPAAARAIGLSGIGHVTVSRL